MKLNGKGVELIGKVIAKPLTNAAVPVDMFDGHDKVPSVWVAEENDFWIVGLINWEEDAKSFRIDLRKLGIKDYGRITAIWNKSRSDKNGDRIELALSPRSCEAFKIMKNK